MDDIEKKLKDNLFWCWVCWYGLVAVILLQASMLAYRTFWMDK